MSTKEKNQEKFLINKLNNWTKINTLSAIEIASSVNELFMWVEGKYGKRSVNWWCKKMEGQLIMSYSNMLKYKKVGKDPVKILKRMKECGIDKELTSLSLKECLTYLDIRSKKTNVQETFEIYGELIPDTEDDVDIEKLTEEVNRLSANEDEDVGNDV